MKNPRTNAQLGLRTLHNLEGDTRQLGYSVTPPQGVLDAAKTRTAYVEAVLTAILADKASHLYSDKLYIDVTEHAADFKHAAETFIAQQRRKLSRTNRIQFLWQRRVVPLLFVLFALLFANRYYQLGEAPTESITELAHAEVGIGAGYAYVTRNIRFYAAMVVVSVIKALIVAGLFYWAGRLYVRFRFPAKDRALDYSLLSAPIAAMYLSEAGLSQDEHEIYNDPF